MHKIDRDQGKHEFKSLVDSIHYSIPPIKLMDSMKKSRCLSWKKSPRIITSGLSATPYNISWSKFDSKSRYIGATWRSSGGTTWSPRTKKSQNFSPRCAESSPNKGWKSQQYGVQIWDELMWVLGANLPIFPLFSLANFRKKFDTIFTCFPSLRVP